MTRVTTADGGTTTFVLKSQGTTWQTISTTGGCSSCGARDRVYTHDREGRVLREQSADGTITTSTYGTDGRLVSKTEHLKTVGCDPATDSNRCRLSPAALATAQLESTVATITTKYERNDPAWPDKVTALVRPSLRASKSRREACTYHPVSGVVTSASVCGWAPTGQACSERATITTVYEAAGEGLAPAFDPGGTFQTAWLALPQPALLVRSVNGPARTPRTSRSLSTIRSTHRCRRCSEDI